MVSSLYRVSRPCIRSLWHGTLPILPWRTYLSFLLFEKSRKVDLRVPSLLKLVFSQLTSTVPSKQGVFTCHNVVNEQLEQMESLSPPTCTDRTVNRTSLFFVEYPVLLQPTCDTDELDSGAFCYSMAQTGSEYELDTLERKWNVQESLETPRSVCCSGQWVYITSYTGKSVLRTDWMSFMELEFVAGESRAPEIKKNGFFESTEDEKRLLVQPVMLVAGFEDEIFMSAFVHEHLLELTIDGRVRIKAGKWEEGSRNGSLAGSQFYMIRGGCVDKENRLLYLSEFGSDQLRVVSFEKDEVRLVTGRKTSSTNLSTGTLSDWSQVAFAGLTSVCIGEYNHLLYATDRTTVREVDMAHDRVSLFSGQKESGYFDGPRLNARFEQLRCIQFVNRKFFVCDDGNSAIRMIDENGLVSTIHRSVMRPGEREFQSQPNLGSLTFTPLGDLVFTLTAYGHIRVLRNVVPPSAFYFTLRQSFSLSSLSAFPSPSSSPSSFIDHGSDSSIPSTIFPTLLSIAYPSLQDHSRLNFFLSELSSLDNPNILLQNLLYSGVIDPQLDLHTLETLCVRLDRS